ncbi:S9 family peptidase [Parahaliea maris]|uniref:S9 family peptidase n=1 Tax=Parahaliea maris TaxID=2716870 RepID=A0A5C9A3B9_9GAMM|nr:prolyl oligopeptidase family serine peptidase [Parahaliea maris]TXS95258.1 S9 family peptidase [Parahaliea maris]
MKRLIAAALLGCAATVTGTAHSAEQPTLELIMSDPDWIGNAPQQPYWADDGNSVYYRQKRLGENFSDLYHLPLAGDSATPIDEARPLSDSGLNKVYNADRSRVAWISQGDVFQKALPGGAVRRVTATTADEGNLQFSPNGKFLQFEREGQFYQYDEAVGSALLLTDIREGKDPDADPGFDPLRAHQARKYRTVVETRRRELAGKAAGRERDQRPEPIYLGDQYKVLSRQLSPAGDTLALVVTDKDADLGRKGTMPNYVTADGYVATREVRTRVGRNTQPAQQVLLVDLASGSVRQVDTDALPGIDRDPLAKLRKSALEWHVDHGADRDEVKKALEAPKVRPVTVGAIEWHSRGIQWSPDGKHLAIEFLAADFKDRWLVTVDPSDDDLTPVVQERLSDEAWINWEYDDFGWLPDSQALWFLSERSGYSHLYRKDLDARKPKALTSGQFVVREPVIGPRAKYAWVVSNRAHPGNYEIYRVPLAGGALQQVTDLDGVSQFTLSPDGNKLLVSRSWIDRHADLYVGNSDGSGELRQLTDTVSERYSAIDWTVPDIVEVPSSHVDRPIYSKLYLPKDHDPGKSYPAVMFVHGAGYTQNAHMGWPYYFREFMFHTLLNEAGYVVLDMDYRASQGYGRDWRTSIYRQMGHPELEDYLDGIDYLAANHGVDRERVGIYGGSYGGFMTFMALFRAPDAFAAGAALRPVADWMHYDNDYTRRILNDPLVDPESFERSSPINHVEGQKAPLLIASGMQDDNVFFQDSVLMVQRLLELKKPDFEMAIYPLDAHGFTNPESWLDEYRRIFRLMENNLK